ncbi:MAG TPA: hypothetical protein VFH56_14310 [Acidimicrobiales bacterium]|nr:hypothetical protein [Acidimicrobiales bacterium]
MNTDSYYDPTWGQRTWTADFHCDDCREDREHEFVRQNGITTAWCTTCDFEAEIDGDEY